MRSSSVMIAAGLLVAAAGAASAMPTARLATNGGHDAFMPVRDGCGWGAHQGLYGGCRLNRGWRGRLRGARGGAPLGCPPGTHPIGRGYCRRNPA